jgi:ABC-type transporter Mla maintaining outer membrane lipid asymmetry ATPase subunit MlaF
MGKSKFIKKIETLFGFDEPETDSKTEAIKELIRKLKDKRNEMKVRLQVTHSEKKKAELKESIAILKKQIKKGEKLLA